MYWREFRLLRLCEHFKYGDTFKGGNAIGHWFNELKKKSAQLIWHLSHEMEDEDAVDILLLYPL